MHEHAVIQKSLQQNSWTARSTEVASGR